MGFILHSLVIETTRRCNIRCEHCMRGEAQNIDMTQELVDILLDKEKIKRVDKICFSGGEPTLNPNIIIYTIDKIIRENLNVSEIVMVTNGQIFNKELLEAFVRFNEYKRKQYGDDDEYVRITFSTDKYHHPIKQEIKDSYYKYGVGIRFTEQNIEDDDIYKTGFASVGKDFTYKLDKFRYCKEKDDYFILDDVYLTATGYVTSEAMGQYIDMDNINMGHIADTPFEKMLAEYGTPIFNTPRIIYEEEINKR